MSAIGDDCLLSCLSCLWLCKYVSCVSGTCLLVAVCFCLLTSSICLCGDCWCVTWSSVSGYAIFCHHSLSGNFLIKKFFCLSPICLLESVLCFLVVWHLSNMVWLTLSYSYPCINVTVSNKCWQSTHILLKHHFISTLNHSNMLQPYWAILKEYNWYIAAAGSTKWVTRCKIKLSLMCVVCCHVGAL